jgi:hypothetical protein
VFKLHDWKNKFILANMVFLGYELCPVLLAHEFGRGSVLFFRDQELEIHGLILSICGNRIAEFTHSIPVGYQGVLPEITAGRE